MDFNFFKAKMPRTRQADYQLGCLDSSVFIDFDLADNNRVSLRRISFDGYGCCDLKESNQLSQNGSEEFLEEMTKDSFNQASITRLVKELIIINKEYIWNDALAQYNLI